MALTTDVSSLMSSNNTPYSARASVGENGTLEAGSTTITGDTSSGLFKNAQKEMGKDDFLLLLVTQLKYQDPLNPMENTEFVAQLAQFRALESSDNIEKAIGNLESSYKSTVDSQQYAAQSVANSSAVSLIGKTVRMRQPAVSWSGITGETVPIRVHLGNASEGVVEIRNADGEVIKSIKTSGKDSENSSTVLWDGTDDKGGPAKAGKYLVSIAGSDKDSSLYAFVQDTVAGVRFTADGVLVKIGGKEISIGEVLDVSTGSSSSALSQSSALSLLGKLVRVRQDSLRYRGASGEQHTFTVNATANQPVTVQLKNSSGQVVRTLTSTADSSGKAIFNWNGESASGSYVDAGEYKINVLGSETNRGLYAYSEGIIDGLTSLGADVKLKMGGREILVSDILDVSTVQKEAA